MADLQGKSGNDQGASAPEGRAAAPAQPQASPRETQQAPATTPKLTEPASPEPAPPVNLLSEKEVRHLSRRELLKLSPLVLAGAFAIPKLRDYLLQAGVDASDRASDATFRRAHPVATYPGPLVAPFLGCHP